MEYRKSPGLAGFAFGHAQLAHVFRRHILGHFSGQFRHHGIAGLVAVEHEGVEAGGNIIQDGAVAVGFPGQRIPVGAGGQFRGEIVVGVHLFVGVVLIAVAGVHIRGHFGPGASAGLGGGDRAAVIDAFADLVGISECEAFCHRGHHARQHAESQHESQQFLHVRYPP